MPDEVEDEAGDRVRLLVREPVRGSRDPMDRQVVDKFIEAVEQGRTGKAVSASPHSTSVGTRIRKCAGFKLQALQAPGSSAVGGYSGDAR